MKYHLTRAELTAYLALIDAFVERFGRNPEREDTARLVADAKALAASDAVS